MFARMWTTHYWRIDATSIQNHWRMSSRPKLSHMWMKRFNCKEDSYVSNNLFSVFRFCYILIFNTRFFSVVHSKPCRGEKSDGTQCDGHPILRARNKVCDFLTTDSWFLWLCDCQFRLGPGNWQSILSAVQIGKLLGKTTIQPVFQKMSTQICWSNFSSRSLSPNSKQYSLVPASFLGTLE